MFSVDDSFEFDDEEFAKVAEGLELASQKEEPPAKRRSFELGFAPGLPNRPLSAKENCHPVKSPDVTSPAVSHSNTPRTSHKGFNFTKFPSASVQRENENLTTVAPKSDLLTHSPSPVGNPHHFETSTARVDTRLQTKRAETSTSNHNPFPPTDFGDLDDLDLDLDLDDPTPWAPAANPDRTSGTASREISHNVQNPQSSNFNQRISEPKNTHVEQQSFLRPAVSTLRQSTSSSIFRNPKDIPDNIPQKDYTEPSPSPRVMPPRNDHATPQRTGMQSSGGPSTPVTNIKVASVLTPRTDIRQTMPTPAQVSPLSTSPDIALRSDSTPGSAVFSAAQSVQSTRSAKSTGNKRKRKFPGPAGLLPRLKPGMDLDEVKPFSPAAPKNTPQKKQADAESEMPSSQSGDDVFLDAPWRQMKDDLESQAGPILEAFSLSTVIRKAGLKQLPRGKVPIVCCSIDGLQVHSADASAVLRDPSGQMKGTIHRQLVKEHGAWLSPGTVLVLRQVGVFSPSVRNHYLNITPSNVVRLYVRAAVGGVTCHGLSAFTEEDFIMPVEPLNRTLSEAGTEQQSILQPLVNHRDQQQGHRSVFSVAPPTGRSPHYQPTGGRYGDGRGRGTGSPSPLVSQGRGRGVGPPPPRGQWTPSPRPPTTPVGPPRPGGPTPRTFNFRGTTPSPRAAPPRPGGPGLTGAPRGVSGQSPTMTGGYGRGSAGWPVAGSTGPRGPSPAMSPASLPRSTGNPGQGMNVPVQDMWGDDQLDDLLTGIEDEMLVDF